MWSRSANSSTSFKEKRRHKRLPASQQATLKLGEMAELPCEIRDYCRGGVFLHLPDEGATLRALRDRTSETVEIRFKPQQESNGKTLCLQGRIVRISQAGAGVSFAEPLSAQSLLALSELAKTNVALASQNQSKVEGSEINRSCLQSLGERLPEITRYFLSQIEPALIQAASSAKTDAEQAAYFDAITTFKKSQFIESEFTAKALAQAQNFAVPENVGDSPSKSQTELSLVDTSEFEDWLNLVSAIGKIEATYHAELQSLEHRLSRIAPHPIHRKNNPYGPMALGFAFGQIISTLPLADQAKKVAYEVFESALRDSMGQLYCRLGELTAPLDAKPKLRREAHAARPNTLSEGNPAPRVKTDSPPTQTDKAQLTGSASRSQYPLHALRAPASAVFAELSRLPGAHMTQTSQYAESSTWSERTSQLLSDWGTSQHRLDNQHVQSLNFLGAVLDTVQADNSIAAGVKPFLQKLQLPLAKAAINDPALLDADTHPVRRTLDLLDQLSLAADENGMMDEKVTRLLSELTERIINEGKQDPGVFEKARQALEQLTAPLQRAKTLRIGRLQEACEGKQRIDSARRTVDREIACRINGRVVPKALLNLIETGWRQWLVLICLRQGQESKEWQDGIAAMDQLSSWLNPESAAPPDLLKAHELIDFIDERLASAGTDQAAQRAITDELTALLIGTGQPKERGRPQLVSVPHDALPGAAEHRMDARVSERVRPFRVGDWLQVSLKPGSSIPLRLTWIGENPARYAFANRKGVKQLELTAEDFARYLEENRASPIENLELPLVERTVSTLMQAMQDRLHHQASHDPTTGLPNRKEFVRQLNRHFAAQKGGDEEYILCIMEIDQLRVINGLCGMEAGDLLLSEFAGLIKQQIGHDELPARLGDNNFGALLRCGSIDEGCRRAGILVDVIRQYRFKWGTRSFSCGLNIGLIRFSERFGGVGSILKNADAACMAAREKGGNQIQVYMEDDETLNAHKQLMEWAGRIDRLLAENRMFVRCQKIEPIVGENKSASHYEILLGVRDECERVVPPGEFVSAAEHWKRITEIDRWQIQSVFRWIRNHPDQFAAIGGFSINLSGQSLNSAEFLDFLQPKLAGADWPLDKITFEITESSAIVEFAQAEYFIRKIKRYGCKFSLDDFGSGFSSYAYLKNLQVDYLKIDGSFVRDMASNDADYAMVKSMNEIGHSLGIKTIAEYVENDAILEKLREIGVDYAQGYHIGKPILIEDLV
ncbi:DUF1631 family protein [Methylocaldum sp.]|uniref:DUF1631 family protein n=1 Tax=Methylocaldum sp. TaxID=1969727 RepID=UPI002D296CDE|nr:DUF1631 family protein [Methylocaldum sp.]HYE36173.1 DUF1631 family protein [Methylocaldum sp.]